MTKKFNNQELIQSHRIKDLNPFYEMLTPTRRIGYIKLDNKSLVRLMPIIFKWAETMKKKDIPYAITIKETKSGVEYVRFWVFGKKIKTDKH